MIYILFAIGFVFLIKGADFLVDGGSSIARRFRLSELIIGLTIVSFGTSMPELIVNLMASFNGKADIAIGNVLGSNISNVLLIIGFSAVVRPLPIQRSTYFTEIPISLIATFMLGFLANANLFTEKDGLYLTRYDGVIMLIFFFLFLTYIFVVARERPSTLSDQASFTSKSGAGTPLWRSISLLALGVAGLFIGGKWIVDGAVHIAGQLGLSETFIGLTVIAIGTSLPELVTSVVAAKKGKADMAVGNVIGSNIFNLLWILGLSATIRPLYFEVASNSDILMVIFSNTLLIFAVIVGAERKVSRLEGVFFLLIYIAYIVYLINRG